MTSDVTVYPSIKLWKLQPSWSSTVRTWMQPYCNDTKYVVRCDFGVIRIPSWELQKNDLGWSLSWPEKAKKGRPPKSVGAVKLYDRSCTSWVDSTEWENSTLQWNENVLAVFFKPSEYQAFVLMACKSWICSPVLGATEDQRVLPSRTGSVKLLHSC